MIDGGFANGLSLSDTSRNEKNVVGTAAYVGNKLQR